MQYAIYKVQQYHQGKGLEIYVMYCELSLTILWLFTQ